MRNNLDLFKLVKSLSRGEIIYLKRVVFRGENSASLYRKIFDEVNSVTQSEFYNEDNIRLKLNVKNKNNFAAAKNYLYELILKNLNSYYSKSNSDNLLKQQIAYIEVLYKKAFFTKSYELLKKTKKKAYSSDNFHRLLDIIRWERNLVIEGAVKGDRQENIIRLFEEEKDMLQKINNISQYRLIAYRLNELMKGYAEPERKGYFTRLKVFRKQPLVKSESNALSFAALATYYNVHSLISLYLGEKERVYLFRKKLVELLENRYEILKGNPANYIVSVYNLTESCYELRRFEEMKMYIERLILFEKNITLPESAMLLMGFAEHRQELKMSLAVSDYRKASASANKLSAHLQSYTGKSTRQDELESRFLIANLYFVTGKFKEASEIFNIIISGKSGETTEDLVINSKILNIITHYELNNIELVYYLIKSLYRSVKHFQNGKKSKILLKFLSKLLKVNGDSELIDVLGELKGKILREYEAKNDYATYNSLKR